MKRSERAKLINKIEKLLLIKLKKERGDRCEICGKRELVGLFHILPKGKYQRIRFNEENLLLAGWWCCHYPYHHDFYKTRDKIIPRIKELRGEDYEDRLKFLNAIEVKLTKFRLECIYHALKNTVKN